MGKRQSKGTNHEKRKLFEHPLTLVLIGAVTTAFLGQMNSCRADAAKAEAEKADRVRQQKADFAKERSDFAIGLIRRSWGRFAAYNAFLRSLESKSESDVAGAWAQQNDVRRQWSTELMVIQIGLDKFFPGTSKPTIRQSFESLLDQIMGLDGIVTRLHEGTLPATAENIKATRDKVNDANARFFHFGEKLTAP